MTTFAQAVSNTKHYAKTANGAKTHATSGNPLLDFFFLAGASRNTDITIPFSIANATDPALALRIALWMRDCRGGAGERESFRKVLKYLHDGGYYKEITALIPFIPIVGRWDDLLVIKSDEVRTFIHTALQRGEGLCAKWMPRQGKDADWVRGDFTPRQWRKLVVGLSNTVEQLMCAQRWKDIVFKHVPSVAAARYQKAFAKHCPHYEQYKKALAAGEEKVNANVIFPHDVIKAFNSGDKVVAQAQWNALPNYMPEGGSIIPVVDVSGSMTHKVSGSTSALDVAVALGIYCSDKLTGAFKDLVCTFSATSELYHLKGDLGAKLNTLMRMKWGMNTNLQAAFKNILDVAVRNKVPEDQMPKTLLILSDMEFDGCVRGETNFKAMKDQYRAAGYNIPNVVFWNLNGRIGNSPVRFNKEGAALVSGFSPAIMQSILGGDIDPIKVMMNTIMKERYNIAI